MSDLPILCDQRGEAGCCGVSVCQTAGLWTEDPYEAGAVLVTKTVAHMHSEPICAHPECETHLTRSQVATLHQRGYGATS